MTPHDRITDDAEKAKTLHDIISADAKDTVGATDDAEKAKNKLLNLLLSDARAIATRKEKRDPTDAEMISQLRKFSDNARINADAYTKLGREPSVIAAALAEIDILKPYLPPEVTDTDVTAFLDGLKASGTLAAGPAGLGGAIKALKEKYGDAFDGKRMTPLAKSALGL